MLVCLGPPEVLGQISFVETIGFAIPHLLHALKARKKSLEIFLSWRFKLSHSISGWQGREIKGGRCS